MTTLPSRLPEPASTGVAAPLPVRQAVRVLVVEDNLTAAFAMRNLLKRIGCAEVVEANDGEAALRLLERQTFDLVLVDWMLPGVSGLVIVRQMRGDSRHRRTPVIMTTAKDQPDDLLAALDAGVSDYILKPATRAVLEAKLARHLGRA